MTQCPLCWRLRVKRGKNPLICHIMNLLWLLSDKRTRLFLLDTRHCGTEGNERVYQLTIDRGLWPWHRPTCKSPLCRFEANGQCLYPAVGSNQVRCGCEWQRSLSLETNTRATKEIPALSQSWRGCYHKTSNFPYQATKSHILSWGPPPTCHHCGQTLMIYHMLPECAVL